MTASEPETTTATTTTATATAAVSTPSTAASAETTTTTTTTTVVTVQPTSATSYVGLDIFKMFDSICVKQDPELLEAITGCETNNSYKVFTTPNAMDAVMSVEETTTCCMRFWCGPGRAASLVVFQRAGQLVMKMERLLRAQSCCCPCCLQKMDVFGPNGELLGTVEQKWSCCAANLRVLNDKRETLFRITGPVSMLQAVCCPKAIEFDVISEKNGGMVGKILKNWTGFVKESFTDADNFTIEFVDKSVEVNEKALLFGALFLIDFMYFEDSDGLEFRIFG